MGWRIRSKVRRALEHTVRAVVPEPAAIAFAAMQRHKRKFGVYPNLIRPRTFNEKVLHRMVFDRRLILRTLLDKYAVREYVRKRVGEHVLPRLYWVTKTPADIPFDDLPDKFVVKPTHGSGWIYLVPDKAHLDRQDLIDKCNAWLGQNYYDTCREWAYKHIEPRIVVEEFISDGSGLAPMDYRCYVCNGRVHMINVMAGRFEDLREGYYGRCWNRLHVTSVFEPIGEVPCPKHLDELIRCAEILGDELGFGRVDLYDAGKVYFGELTVYPVAGVKVFRPYEWDRYLGSMCDSVGSEEPLHGIRKPRAKR
jgi:TupA-like ATPgrasp